MKRMAIVNKMENAGQDTEKLETLYIAGENAKWYSHSGKQLAGSGKC